MGWLLLNTQLQGYPVFVHRLRRIGDLYFYILLAYSFDEQTNKKSQQEVATSTSNNYLLLNDVIFNFHDVKRNLSLHEMVYINGKDSCWNPFFSL